MASSNPAPTMSLPKAPPKPPIQPKTPPAPPDPAPPTTKETPSTPANPPPPPPPPPAPPFLFTNHLTASPEPLPSTLAPAPTSYSGVSRPPTLLIGVSGCTSSGKTTLAHLLSMIFPPTNPVSIIYQDDFFIPEYLLVPSATEKEDEEYDSDCDDVVKLDALYRMLRHAKRAGRSPGGYITLRAEEEEMAKAKAMVDATLIEALQTAVQKSGLFENGKPVVLVDGFLLYHSSRFRELLNIKLFVRASRQRAREKRFERARYKIPGVGDFWQTDRYFDEVVWPNYVSAHESLFEFDDVEGTPVRRECEGLGIVIQPVLDGSGGETLVWAVNAIMESCGRLERGRQDGSEGRESGGETGLLHWVTGHWLEMIRQTLFDLI